MIYKPKVYFTSNVFSEKEIGSNKKISEFRSRKHPTHQKPHGVIVDNTSSSFFSIIEVYAYDFPGLLFCITDALFRCNLNIWGAKIATQADQVVDVFYVRDLNGQKVDNPQQEDQIKTAIAEMIPNMQLSILKRRKTKWSSKSLLAMTLRSFFKLPR